MSTEPADALRAIATFVVCLSFGCGDARVPPNVLIVVMDTTRADRLSVNGYERDTTPALVEFARDAVVFTDTWSPSNWTPPAHASMFTGLRPEHHGQMNGLQLHLPEIVVTLAERLADHGFGTAAWINNPFLGEAFGSLQGFANVHELYGGTRTGPKAHASADESLKLALEWTATQDRPWFAFVNLMEAHEPYLPGDADRRRLQRIEHSAEELAWGRTFDHHAIARHNFGVERIPPQRIALLSDLYDAEIAAQDRALGTLLESLRERGELDRTVVVITADHGENFDEHGLVHHILSAHRTLLHVPLIIRWPGVFDGGRVDAGVARLEDVAPTVLDLVGLDIPGGLDGLSLRDRSQPRVARALIGSVKTLLVPMVRDHPDWDIARWDRSMASVYDGRLHYIRRSDGTESLFDVKADPLEQSDLAPTGRVDVERLRTLLPKPE